jgi:hypothetical protein
LGKMKMRLWQTKEGIMTSRCKNEQFILIKFKANNT